MDLVEEYVDDGGGAALFVDQCMDFDEASPLSEAPFTSPLASSPPDEVPLSFLAEDTPLSLNEEEEPVPFIVGDDEASHEPAPLFVPAPPPLAFLVDAPPVISGPPQVPSLRELLMRKKAAVRAHSPRKNRKRRLPDDDDDEDDNGDTTFRPHKRAKTPLRETPAREVPAAAAPIREAELMELVEDAPPFTPAPPLPASQFPTLGLSVFKQILPVPSFVRTQRPPLEDFVPVWRPRPDAALLFEPIPNQFACAMRILRAQLWSFVPQVRGHRWKRVPPILRALRLVLILGIISNNPKRPTVACSVPFLTALHVPHWGWLLGRLAAALSLIHYIDTHDLHDEGSRLPDQEELDGFKLQLASPATHERLYLELSRHLFGLPTNPALRHCVGPHILYFLGPLQTPFIGSLVTYGLALNGRNAVELDDELTCRLTPLCEQLELGADADAGTR